MLKEAFEFLTKLGSKADRVYDIRHDTPVGKIEVINNMTGDIRWEDVPFNEYGNVDSIEDLVNVVAEFTPDVDKYPQPTIWVSKQEAVFFPYADSQNYFSLQLIANPVFAFISRCSGQHKQVMNTLRYEIAPIVHIAQSDFMLAMSALKFDTTTETGSIVRQGDESLSKSIKSKVTGEAKLPEFVVFNFHVYPELDIDTKFDLVCSVIIDPSAGTISVKPLPGEVEQMKLKAQARVVYEINDRIRRHEKIEDVIPVYRGTYRG